MKTLILQWKKNNSFKFAYYINTLIFVNLVHFISTILKIYQFTIFFFYLEWNYWGFALFHFCRLQEKRSTVCWHVKKSIKDGKVLQELHDDIDNFISFVYHMPLSRNICKATHIWEKKVQIMEVWTYKIAEFYRFIAT